MNMLLDLDQGIAAAATLAKALEAQIGPAFMARMRLVAWVSEQFEDPAALQRAVEELPLLSSQLCLDYECFRGYMI
ncbi:hypothetical protein [Pseudomonas japonica]|uniref:hypothetical protein n=1 Tax=Pseudomonas japonica TaxID=256466 RepID=UPI0015E3489B|nr:hypothetical protein [Pseudomonas japonica]MBA1290572.1 hypothetical protein [Pseudomonas japonica]